MEAQTTAYSLPTRDLMRAFRITLNMIDKLGELMTSCEKREDNLNVFKNNSHTGNDRENLKRKLDILNHSYSVAEVSPNKMSTGEKLESPHEAHFNSDQGSTTDEMCDKRELSVRSFPLTSTSHHGPSHARTRSETNTPFSCRSVEEEEDTDELHSTLHRHRHAKLPKTPPPFTSSSRGYGPRETAAPNCNGTASRSQSDSNSNSTAAGAPGSVVESNLAVKMEHQNSLNQLDVKNVSNTTPSGQLELRHWRVANADKLNALIDECERYVDGRKVYKCKFCGKVYEIKSSMRYHMKIIHLQLHLKTTDMQCRVCGKQFTCISAVNRHQLKCSAANGVNLDRLTGPSGGRAQSPSGNVGSDGHYGGLLGASDTSHENGKSSGRLLQGHAPWSNLLNSGGKSNPASMLSGSSGVGGSSLQTPNFDEMMQNFMLQHTAGSRQSATGLGSGGLFPNFRGNDDNARSPAQLMSNPMDMLTSAMLKHMTPHGFLNRVLEASQQQQQNNNDLSNGGGNSSNNSNSNNNHTGMSSPTNASEARSGFSSAIASNAINLMLGTNPILDK